MQTALLRPGMLLGGLIAVLGVSVPDAAAQNLLVNGDFSNGNEGWTWWDMGGEVEAEVEFTDVPECPTNGTPGGCVVLFGTGSYVNTLVWQEVTLIAGTPYRVDGQFRSLVESISNFWGQLYLSDDPPVEFQDWTPGGNTEMQFGFNWWNGCDGVGIDGTFSEHACEGRLDPIFVPPGTPGEEVTYYIGFKVGVNEMNTFAVSIDDISIELAAETFAIASFSTEPSGRALVDETIIFDASESSASGTITDYAWDFGDGTTASGVTAEHAYAELGEYEVQLIVTSDDGAADTLASDVTVWEGIGLPENPLQIPMAPSIPAIDGEMEAAWDGAQHVSVATHTNNDPPSSPEDLTVDAYVMWDADNFYIFFDIVDDSLHNDSGNTWEDDAPEFYLDGGNEKDSLYDANDEAWELGWDNTTITGRGAGRAQGGEMASLTKADGTGYTVEAMMPWSNIGVAPVVGDMIGFEAAINDDDSGSGRDTKLAWFSPPGNDNAWQWSYIWGNAILVEAISSAAEPEAGIPGTFALEGVYPNPFNPSTTAILAVREAGDYTVRLFNVLGQLVEERQLTAQAPGRVQIPFDLAGRASGTYLVWVQHRASGRVVTAKAMLLK